MSIDSLYIANNMDPDQTTPLGESNQDSKCFLVWTSLEYMQQMFSEGRIFCPKRISRIGFKNQRTCCQLRNTYVLLTELERAM